MPHFVKKFDINGVKTRQVACIELHGKPNAATKGAVGVLGIDVDSPSHELYICVAVNGAIHTWEEASGNTPMPVPTPNAEKKLTEAGYYAVNCIWSGIPYVFPLFYYEPSSLAVRVDGAGMRLKIDSDGSLSFCSISQSVDENGRLTTTEYDYTLSTTFNVAKLS